MQSNQSVSQVGLINTVILSNYIFLGICFPNLPQSTLQFYNYSDGSYFNKNAIIYVRERFVSGE
jgi:hypothetical protein